MVALLPTFSGGAHTVVEMKDGEITRLNPYSLMSDPWIKRLHDFCAPRRRGPWWFALHAQKRRRRRQMVISYPVNLFALICARRSTVYRRRYRHHAVPGANQTVRAWAVHGNCTIAVAHEALGSYVDELTVNASLRSARLL